MFYLFYESLACDVPGRKIDKLDKIAEKEVKWRLKNVKLFYGVIKMEILKWRRKNATHTNQLFTQLFTLARYLTYLSEQQGIFEASIRLIVWGRISGIIMNIRSIPNMINISGNINSKIRSIIEQFRRLFYLVNLWGPDIRHTHGNPVRSISNMIYISGNIISKIRSIEEQQGSFEAYSTQLLVWIKDKTLEIKERDFPNSLDEIQFYFKKFKVRYRRS